MEIAKYVKKSKGYSEKTTDTRTVATGKLKKQTEELRETLKMKEKQQQQVIRKEMKYSYLSLTITTSYTIIKIRKVDHHYKNLSQTKKHI